MATLNRARPRPRSPGVTAATDVTGFGLLGHAATIARESRLTLEIDASALPLLPGARDLAPRFQPGGLKANRRAFEPRVEYQGRPDETLAVLLFDPQTSGGLLLLVPEAKRMRSSPRRRARPSSAGPSPPAPNR